MYSYLATPTQTKATLAQFGLSAKYKLGQNFLVNDDVIGKIIRLADLSEDDVVVEVGPGIGTLTCALLQHAKACCSIETDRDLPQVLSETLAQDSEKFALIQADALKVGPVEVSEALGGLGMGELAPSAFVSNLPYQVAATLILRYLQEFDTLKQCVVMVQSEVADRISAVPGNKTYGAYTAKLGLIGEVTGRFQVGPQNFMPAPHVESAVVKIERKPFEYQGEKLDSDMLSFVSQVIDAAFAQRRKTIRNSMSSSGFEKDALDAAFEQCGIAPTVRAEKLSTSEFVELAFALHN